MKLNSVVRWTLILSLWLAMWGLLVGVASAQVAAPDPGTDPIGFFKVLFDLIVQHNWWAVASVATIGVIWLAQKGPLRRWSFWETRWGGWLLNLVVAVGGALATAGLAGEKVTPKLVITAVQVGGLAAGLWELIKDLGIIKKVTDWLKNFLGYDTTAE